jgi:hypothetical protein
MPDGAADSDHEVRCLELWLMSVLVISLHHSDRLILER